MNGGLVEKFTNDLSRAINEICITYNLTFINFFMAV